MFSFVLFNEILIEIHKMFALSQKTKDLNETQVTCLPHQKFLDPESWLLTFNIQLEYILLCV